VRKVVSGICLLLGLGAAGFAVLVTPGNPLLRAFRGGISDIAARVVTGPYPTEEDLDTLRQDGVSVVVSLLDPALPYERVLLARERTAAAQRGMRLLSFPMTSVLGHEIGNGAATAEAAARAIADADGKVYVHCYLGLHRVKRVADALARQGTTAGTYNVRAGERSAAARALDRAQAAFDGGDYGAALAALDALAEPTPEARLLAGWSHYRRDEIDEAARAFREAATRAPRLVEARAGLGYCALRRDRRAEAESHFAAALAAQGDDASATIGMGLTLARDDARRAEAVQWLERGLAREPGNAEARAVLARLHAAR
jgi:tetratricopeptide (TPR) repeat protein